MYVGTEETIGASINDLPRLKTILHFAAAGKSDASAILEHIITQLKESIVNQQNFKGQTPLHIAITHCDEPAAEQLLAAGKFLEESSAALERMFLSGADPSLIDQDGNTALHLSTILMSQFHPSSILSTMVSARPDLLCQTNKLGYIPLHIALRSFDYQTINFLLPENDGHLTESAHRSLYMLDTLGRHALHYAAQSGLTNFIQRYFKAASKEIINQQDLSGLTPLHCSW